MENLFELMGRQHGVVSVGIARAMGLTWRRQRALIEMGLLTSPARGVLCARAAPTTWRRRVALGVYAAGDGVVSHGAAARLHHLKGFESYGWVDVLYRGGVRPGCSDDVITHFTRADPAPETRIIDGLPSLSLGATLALLPTVAGPAAVGLALDDLFERGADVVALCTVVERWAVRGRPGPARMLALLEAGLASRSVSVGRARPEFDTLVR